jgi:hypothetical protein
MISNSNRSDSVAKKKPSSTTQPVSDVRSGGVAAGNPNQDAVSTVKQRRFKIVMVGGSLKMVEIKRR